MTSDELNELIVTCFTFADKIGIDLNFPDNENFIRELQVNLKNRIIINYEREIFNNDR